MLIRREPGLYSDRGSRELNGGCHRHCHVGCGAYIGRVFSDRQSLGDWQPITKMRARFEFVFVVTAQAPKAGKRQSPGPMNRTCRREHQLTSHSCLEVICFAYDFRVDNFIIISSRWPANLANPLVRSECEFPEPSR